MESAWTSNIYGTYGMLTIVYQTETTSHHTYMRSEDDLALAAAVYADKGGREPFAAWPRIMEETHPLSASSHIAFKSLAAMPLVLAAIASNSYTNSLSSE